MKFIVSDKTMQANYEKIHFRVCTGN